MRFVDFSNKLVERTESLGEGWILVAETDSTQRLARRILEEYFREDQRLPEVTLFAWRQDAGRGRQDHTWSSPSGAGVYATLVRRVADIARLQELPVTVAVSLGVWLRRFLGGRGGLKWPNDLVVDDKKVGGVLLEAVTRCERSAILIGIGLNHSQDLSLFEQEGATSLRAESSTRPEASLCDVAVDVVAAIDEGLASDQGLDEVVARYRELIVHRRGDRLRCRLEGEIVEGAFLGFNPHGFLRLDVAGAERIIHAGELIDHV